MAPETVMSSMTASICARTKAAGKTWTAFTCAVFWAVTQVIAVVPNTPRAAKVLRSAWIPAPPPESEPAMVSATGGVIAAPRQGVPGFWRTRPLGRGNAGPLPTPRHPSHPTRGIPLRSPVDPPKCPSRQGGACESRRSERWAIAGLRPGRVDGRKSRPLATFGAGSRQILVTVTRTPDRDLTSPARPEVGRSEVDAVRRPRPGAGALYENATDCVEHLR